MEIDPEEFADVPDSVMQVIEHVGVVDPEDKDGDLEWLIDRFTHGKCMVCASKLAEDTVVIVNNLGVVGMYCSGPCLQDMGNLGWLDEQRADIMDKIRFRSDPEAADGA